MSKKNICSNCQHENDPSVRYCQRCGRYLPIKETLLEEVKSWDFRSLAGLGRKDINVAPLFTAPKTETPRRPSNAPVDPLPDGRWYCPDCGTLNTSSELSCRNCGKIR